MHLSFLFSLLPCSGHPRDLHSFPTRRSSDLISPDLEYSISMACTMALSPPPTSSAEISSASWAVTGSSSLARSISDDVARSEEHTSELQSRGHLVCRLLLEKKKQADTCGDTR